MTPFFWSKTGLLFRAISGFFDVFRGIFILGVFGVFQDMSSSTSIDNNFYSIFGVTGQGIDGQVYMPENPSQYAAILKVSHSTGIHGIALTVSNGQENSVDINVCKDMTLSGVYGLSGVTADQCITIKGGSESIYVAGVINCNGSRADVQIGDWSDQEDALSKNVTLDLVRADGKPVKVQVGRATGIVLKGSCVRSWWSDFLLTAYWWIKLIVRKIMRIPIGTKGPSWL